MVTVAIKICARKPSLVEEIHKVDTGLGLTVLHYMVVKILIPSPQRHTGNYEYVIFSNYYYNLTWHLGTL